MITTIVCTPPLRSGGGLERLNILPIFKKEVLTGSQFLKGVAGKDWGAFSGVTV